jgi:hypothetical protein
MHDELVLPYWHSRDPALLFDAVKQAREVAPHLETLITSFLPRMPRLVQASWSMKTAFPSSGTALLSLAISAPWMSFDAAGVRNVLLLDIDHSSGVDLALELPARIRPHIVVDPWSGRSAGILVLKSAVLTASGSRAGPRFLADIAHQLIANHFRATPLSHGSLAKNPFGLTDSLSGDLLRRTRVPSSPIQWEAWKASGTRLIWHTVVGAHSVELRDILAVLGDDDAPRPRTSKKKYHGPPSQFGRNCELFDLVRVWAYDQSAKDEIAIRSKANELNAGFASPLPVKEVETIAKSIARYMQKKYRQHKSTDEGVMNLQGTQFTLRQKQHLSAVRTNDIRQENTDRAIRDTIKSWPIDKKMTQAALAVAARVSKKSVKRRWRTLAKT